MSPLSRDGKWGLAGWGAFMVGSSAVKHLNAPRGARVALAAALATVGLLSASPSAEAVRGFSFGPHVGGPHATFVARFVAPYHVHERSDESGANYEFAARGPKGCRFVATSTSTDQQLNPGDRVTLLVDRLWALDERENWCPGRYVGHLSYTKWNAASVETERRTLVSGIVFWVRSRQQLQRQPRRPPAFEFSPRPGGPHETFVARFTARYRTSHSDRRRTSYYTFLARGPRPCHDVDTGYYPHAPDWVRGDRVVIGISPFDIGAGRRRWCPGRYVGRVIYLRQNRKDEVILQRSVASSIVFRVRPQLTLSWW
jgi:hypothetical protein